jgi:hypothetical protein
MWYDQYVETSQGNPAVSKTSPAETSAHIYEAAKCRLRKCHSSHNPNLTCEFNSRVTLAENDSSFAYDTEKRDTPHKDDYYDILTIDCNNQRKNRHTSMLTQYIMYQNIPGLRSN